MRIIQLLAGTGQGGADRVAIALGDGLRQRGHEAVFAVNPEFLKFQTAVAQAHPCWPIHRFRGLPWRELREFKRRATSFDVVMTHDSGGRHFSIWAKLSGLRPPVWFVRHCISGTTRFGGVQLHRLVTDHQIAVSDIIARGLLKSGFPQDRVTRIHGGIDLAPFRQPDPQRVNAVRQQLLAKLPPETVIVGMVARLHLGKDWRADKPDFKGYDVLFRALAQARFPWRVLALGPSRPVDHDAVRQIARHNGADPERIIFAGFVDEPSAHYAVMHINVLPSRNEGLGLAVIESMASGIPTIGSRGGGIVEIIQDNQSGLLFEEGNSEELRQQLEHLVADSELRMRLSQGGRKRAVKAFDASVMVTAFEELMKRKLGPRARATE
ncbi:MAG TPA: glycosyltransferase family 4 protein [Verrucomicrobiota bacterium]|nr:glycosyl transferase family 1 [Verrucomicrobiales bacterium]HRI13261.1 glycosyltransferase family 4 protein [Verrucomicrobiota bacterium]